jgi:hypothetical protein
MAEWSAGARVVRKVTPPPPKHHHHHHTRSQLQTGLAHKQPGCPASAVTTRPVNHSDPPGRRPG